MNKYRSLLFVVALAAIFNSCKLDPVVLPPGTIIGPNNGQTVLGITVNGGIINNAYLTGHWQVAYTTEQYYSNQTVVSGTLTTDKFKSVTLDDVQKKISYHGYSSNGNYILSLNTNVLFIRLPADPFGRSMNADVRITSLTSTSMTWVAIDPAVVMVNGQPMNKAWQVVFIR